MVRTPRRQAPRDASSGNAPSNPLTRITCEPGDGAPAAAGVEAMARALEHVHLGWALVGALLRLPVLREFVQLIVDASGGEPRKIDRGSAEAGHYVG